MTDISQYIVVSIFSGGMGLDLGLKSTEQFRILACIEKDNACCETIRRNQQSGKLDRNMKVFERDICAVSPSEVLDAIGLQPEELDLIVGGPPCQSFSTAGKRRTVQDPRGTLLWQYLHFVEVIKPKFFLMENVRGLLSAALRHRPIAKRPEKVCLALEPDEEPGSVVKLFASDLKNIPGASYHMDCFEVNAVNYGAPQIRERALFIGNRYNAVVDFPDPTRGPSEEKEMQLSLFGNESDRKPWATLRDAIGDLREDNPIVMDFSPRKKYYLSLVPEGSNWRILPVEIQKESMGKAWYAKGGRSGWWRRLTFDLPCPTLVTMPNHASTSLCHPTETRALSVREYARIQEFPDDWELAGSVAQQYAQVGNAVPTRLSQVAGTVIAEQLDRLAQRGWKPYKEEQQDYRVIYLQSHVRTRQWFKAGKTYIWSDRSADGPKNRDYNSQAAYGAPKTTNNAKSDYHRPKKL
ncbi:MAG: DNA cytosine methyltransferase [Hormoscilla sp. SP12CHS1]|nr:DNA cytosine methyltransferase [Hormoscilla sp. SP12CHS1]